MPMMGIQVVATAEPRKRGSNAVGEPGVPEQGDTRLCCLMARERSTTICKLTNSASI